VAERWWYSHHQPAVGGTPDTTLWAIRNAPTRVRRRERFIYTPHPARSASLASTLPDHLDAPADIRPIAVKPPSARGSLETNRATVEGVPSEYRAYLRPDQIHNGLTTGVVWMDTKL